MLFSPKILGKTIDFIRKIPATPLPLRKRIIVALHRTGSCISRLLITNANERLCANTSSKPPAAVRLSVETKQFVTQALIFRLRQEIGGVIFVSGPNRGTEIPSNCVGRFASCLIKSPISLLKAGHEAMKRMTTRGDALNVTASLPPT